MFCKIYFICVTNKIKQVDHVGNADHDRIENVGLVDNFVKHAEYIDLVGNVGHFVHIVNMYKVDNEMVTVLTILSLLISLTCIKLQTW